MKTHKLAPTTGTYTEEEANKLFGWIDSDIENYGCSENDPATKELSFTAKSLEKNSTFKEMFAGNDYYFTKAQILEIVKNHSALLSKKGWGNFFPYQNKEGKRFVFGVWFSDGEWRLYVSVLEDTYVWDADGGDVIFLNESLEPLETLSLAIEQVKNAGYEVYKRM